MADSTAGVLFDVDGTLVDTNHLHVLAWRRALADHAEVAPMAELHRRIGMGADRLVLDLLGHDVPGIADSHQRRFAELRDEASVLPGAREVVRAVHNRGLAVVLASSASEDDVAFMRTLLDVDDVVDTVTSSADADKTKPDPDLLTTAIERAGLDRSATVAVGDAVWDVEACARIGVPCIGVRSGGTSAAELEAAGAVCVFDDAEDLLAHLDDTPIAALADQEARSRGR